MSRELTNLSLRGFKSIADTTLTFGRVNVMIGSNGSGKSNLIAFFRMLNYMMAPPTGSLQRYIADNGGAARLLHDGPKRTREIEAILAVHTDQGENDYAFRLTHAVGDTLIFAEERCRFTKTGVHPHRPWQQLNAGHHEARMLERQQDVARRTAETIAALLRGFAVHQFHDTSSTARIKRRWAIADTRYLKHDAGNLGAFLHLMRQQFPPYYRRIVETIRQIAPFFDDFILDDENGYVLLRWRERDSDAEFIADQASDGALRAMALATLLLQPPANLPSLLVVDEPELGLHPYAINIIGGLLKAVSQHCQVIVATQSPLLLDQLDPQDVVVVERSGRESHFTRVDEKKLHEWLEEFTLGDLWNRNVLGGRPREVAS